VRSIAGGDSFSDTALRLDGDAALPLQVHGVEHLLRHFPLGSVPPHIWMKTVGERGLAVVDVGDD
jgi:hypothetical protein